MKDFRGLEEETPGERLGQGGQENNVVPELAEGLMLSMRLALLTDKQSS